ncbi:hypothetical protein ACFL1Z_04045 [Thermodesulfobacteriota bacterium]
MEILLVRAIERIIGVIIGGVSVYLGYRLFLNLPDQTDSEGRFILPGNISIYMSRVGPGAFFALFGTAVVVASMYFSLEIQDMHQKNGEQQSNKTYYSYLGDDETLDEAMANIAGDFFILNQLQSSLDGNLSATQKNDIERAIPRIKVALMSMVWANDKEWGDYKEFKKWVMSGTNSPPPKELEKAAQYYNHGK